MISRADITARTKIAGVVGSPVAHSLSPILHNAWLGDAGIDGVYIAFAPPPDSFESFIDGLRSSGVVGVNVTLPFKQRALLLADSIDPSAEAAGAANLLIFDASGQVEALNTDGFGLLAAFAEQAPSWTPRSGPTVVLGAGGAARGAAAALVAAGGQVRIVNRTEAHAQALAAEFSDVRTFALDALAEALRGATALVNTASAQAWEEEALATALDLMSPDAVVMDMNYTPLRTALLTLAQSRGRPTVDGLAMLIGQGRPSFAALFGTEPPSMDVRGRALKALGVSR